MTTWNDNTKRLESFMGVHQTTVTSISWSSNGTRLITGDSVNNNNFKSILNINYIKKY